MGVKGKVVYTYNVDGKVIQKEYKPPISMEAGLGVRVVPLEAIKMIKTEVQKFKESQK